MITTQTTHRDLTPENLFEPANAEHLATIAWRFPTADMDVLRDGIANGDKAMIDWAMFMISDYAQTIEASALARIHKTVVKEEGRDADGRFLEVWAPLPDGDAEFSGRVGIKVYATGDEANDQRSVRTALLSVVHTLREREVDPAAWVSPVEGGAA